MKLTQHTGKTFTCSTMGGPANNALQAEAATDKAPLTSSPAMLLP